MARLFSTFRVLFALALLIFFGSGAAPVPGGSIPNVPVPDAAAQRVARGRVNEIFREDIAKAKKPGEKTAVARKLLQTANETGNDASVKYVALTMAREIAISDDDAETAMAAIAGLEAYAIDSLKLKADTLIAIMKSTGSPQDSLVGPVVDQAIDADHFQVARQLAEKALATAKSAGDAGAVANANAWLQQVREIETASAAASNAASTLLTKPGDPVACSTTGRFEAFFKNRWDKALPLLASGNDATLKSLAQIELAARADPTKQIQVADGWWGISIKERGISQKHLREHAAYWYKAAMPRLAGLEKARAENRVKEGSTVRPSYTGWNDLLRKVKVERDAIRGKWSLEGGSLSMGPRAELRIAAKLEKTYALRIEFVRLDANNSGAALGIVLPVAETEVVLFIDPDRMGLEFVDGKRWVENETTKRGDFGGVRKKHLVEVTVWQEPEARIIVVVDGKPEIEWTGLPSKLSSHGDWTIQPPALGIGSWDTSLTISRMALKESVDVEPH